MGYVEGIRWGAPGVALEFGAWSNKARVRRPHGHMRGCVAVWRPVRFAAHRIFAHACARDCCVCCHLPPMEVVAQPCRGVCYPGSLGLACRTTGLHAHRQTTGTRMGHTGMHACTHGDTAARIHGGHAAASSQAYTHMYNRGVATPRARRWCIRTLLRHVGGHALVRQLRAWCGRHSALRGIKDTGRVGPTRRIVGRRSRCAVQQYRIYHGRSAHP